MSSFYVHAGFSVGSLVEDTLQCLGSGTLRTLSVSLVNHEGHQPRTVLKQSNVQLQWQSMTAKLTCSISRVSKF